MDYWESSTCESAHGFLPDVIDEPAFRHGPLPMFSAPVSRGSSQTVGNIVA